MLPTHSDITLPQTWLVRNKDFVVLVTIIRCKQKPIKREQQLKVYTKDKSD